ncbi:MAG: hypothetical protein AAF693_09950 [Bacteroidota bacterium]
MRQYVALYALLMSFISCSELRTASTEEVKDSTNHHFDFDRSYGDFTIREDFTSGYRLLRFSSPDSLGVFTHIKLTVSNNSVIFLTTELNELDKLWNAVTDSIYINLKSVSVGYPLNYEDILKNQIEAFKSDSSWRSLEDDGINYTQLRSTMINKGVYSPLIEWLASKRYKIMALSTEKHGIVPDVDLKRLGYTGSEEIPLPFMVWFQVERSNDTTF